jgi:hypothetical protein
MAQRDEVGGLFGRLNAGNLRNRQDVAFGQSISLERLNSGWGAHQSALSDGAAAARRLLPDVNHSCATLRIQVRKFFFHSI